MVTTRDILIAKRIRNSIVVENKLIETTEGLAQLLKDLEERVEINEISITQLFTEQAVQRDEIDAIEAEQIVQNDRITAVEDDLQSLLIPEVGAAAGFALFGQFFTDDGLSTGSQAMSVDGSTTPVKFFIKADATNDLWIKTIGFDIGDTSNALDNLAGQAAPIGLQLDWDLEGLVTFPLAHWTNNYEIIAAAGGEPAFGTGQDSFRAAIAGGNRPNPYLPTLDMDKVFGIPGIRLRAGTTDELSLTVNDNLSGADFLQVRARGFVKFPTP